jgi:hypothetical protein
VVARADDERGLLSAIAVGYATGLSLSNILCLCGGSDMGRGWRRYKFSDFTRRDDGSHQER